MSTHKKTVADHAAEGGKARAETMTAEERSESARIAAQARWNKVASFFPKETHNGVLQIIPDRPIECSVLENGTRVFSARGMSRALGTGRTGGSQRMVGAPEFPPFLTSQNVFPFVPEELKARLTSPIIYRPKHGGRTAFGYEATLLPDICGVILDADKAKPLWKSQRPLVEAATLIVRGLARVGIIALVDEATGYQEDRARAELSQILRAYVAEELRQWVGVFPAEFFKQIYRIHGWQFREGNTKRTPQVGKLINKLIYEQLPPPVLPELRRKNPSDEKYQRKHKHYQFLTGHTGIPNLDKQITAVTTLMKASKNKQMFEHLFNAAFPRKGEQLRLIEDSTDD